MIATWVIGSHGLLGSALCRTLLRAEAELFFPDERFRWDSESGLFVQMESAVKKFAELVDSEEGWQIYWAAGVGTMGSEEEELAVETRVLSTLLRLVATEQRLMSASGCFVFASSAGAIYSGTTDEIINENTPVAPTTAYGREKIKQECLITEFAQTNSSTTALLARISTLYGPGQAGGKQQGLISLIARRLLRNEPIQIFVPFDTIRDYVTADDAASLIVASRRAILGRPGIFIKIVASEVPTTIAEIISSFKRVARRRPRVIGSSSKLASLYSRRTQFNSIAIPLSEKISKTSLSVGVAEVMAAERLAYSRSCK